MKGIFVNGGGKTPSGYARDKPVAFSDDGVPIYAFNEKGQPICFSRKRLKKDSVWPRRPRCRRTTLGIKGSTELGKNGRCKHHGGLRKVGIESSTFKHGNRSVVLTKFRDEIFTAQSDPDYLCLRNIIALNTARLLEIAERMNSRRLCEDDWKRINLKMQKLIDMIEGDNIFLQNVVALGPKSKMVKFVEYVEDVMRTLQRESEQYKLHKEMSAAARDRAKLIETEIKRMAMERNYMPADHVLTLFVSTMKTVARHVKDKAILRAIRFDLNKLSDNPQNRKALGGMTMPADGGIVPQTFVEEEFMNQIEEAKPIRRESAPEVQALYLSPEKFSDEMNKVHKTGGELTEEYEFDIEELREIVMRESEATEKATEGKLTKLRTYIQESARDEMTRDMRKVSSGPRQSFSEKVERKNRILKMKTKSKSKPDHSETITALRDHINSMQPVKRKVRFTS